jgi:HPt (histidine-containing phosphotransfer) domain-containing protein
MTLDSDRADEGVLDAATLQALLEDVGPEQLPLVLGLFAEELARRASELRSASEAKDAEGLRRAAHGVKGSASTFGARRLAAAAGRLETDCRSNRPVQELVAGCEALRVEMTRTVEWVRRRLDPAGEMK